MSVLIPCLHLTCTFNEPVVHVIIVTLQCQHVISELFDLNVGSTTSDVRLINNEMYSIQTIQNVDIFEEIADILLCS